MTPIGKKCLAALAPLVLALVLSPMRTDAQTQAKSVAYTWKNVTVGGGGFIPGIVFSPVEKGLVYLRSDMGGCYRWEARRETWIPLNDAMSESSYHGGESIAPDPQDANVVYIAAGMYRSDPSAILRSKDRGQTWQVFPVSFRMGGNEDGRGLGERLAIDPNETGTLYFGSRHDGLMRSVDHGESWKAVESFPVKGQGTPGRGRPSSGGLSFVVFDPRSGSSGKTSQTIFVGSADPGQQHLFRSDDAGQSWKAIEGGPDGGPGGAMLPAKAAIDSGGILYITYGNGIGPNGVTDGAVFALDSQTGQWTDITPDKRTDRPRGGYCGLSLDRQNPGTLAVSTMNRWAPGDTVWRSTDGGKTWLDIAAKSERDVSATPFLLWGKPRARLGWWLAALAIDPFDSDHVVYGTGATVFVTKNFSNVSKDAPTNWTPWVTGIEQTAIITLCSPSDGPHLLSGFGDIGGFVHDDVDRSPPQGMYDHPMFDNTNTIDYAGAQPNVIVRSGRPQGGAASLAVSDDGGKAWQPLKVPTDVSAPAVQRGQRGNAQTPAITVSADGKRLIVMTRQPMISSDRGASWTAVKGLPDNAHPVADRVDPNSFYAIDFDKGQLYVSGDGGQTFTVASTTGLPSEIHADRPYSGEAPSPLSAAPGKQADLWFVSKAGLLHSADGGKTFNGVNGGVRVQALSFGKPPKGRDDPTLFAIGTKDRTKAILRSDDSGQSWMQINDDQHQWGTRFRCISGDPRIIGRVYVGTDGRGILYGDDGVHD